MWLAQCGFDSCPSDYILTDNKTMRYTKDNPPAELAQITTIATPNVEGYMYSRVIWGWWGRPEGWQRRGSQTSGCRADLLRRQGGLSRSLRRATENQWLHRYTTNNKPMTLPVITPEFIREFDPCYDPSTHLEDGYSASLSEFLLIDHIPAKDRVWLCCQPGVLPVKELRLLAAKWARRALSRVAEPDPRSTAACDVSEQCTNGKATQKDAMKAWLEAADARREASGEVEADANLSPTLKEAAAWAAERASSWASEGPSRIKKWTGAQAAATWAAWAASEDPNCYVAEGAEVAEDTERQQQLQDILEVIKTINQSSND